MPERYNRGGGRRAVLTSGDGSSPKLPHGPLVRECPKCGAAIGRPCTRYIAARVGGKDIGGGYTRTLMKPHTERQKRRETGEGGERRG